MKTKLFALAVTIGLVLAVAAGPAMADDVPGPTLNHLFGSPIYATYVATGHYFHDPSARPTASTDYMKIDGSVWADITNSPTTWRYPSPGIPAGWLFARVSLQFDSIQADGVPDGNCGTYDGQNAAGTYVGYVTHTWNATALLNCALNVGDAFWVRAVVRLKDNPGGLGWQDHYYYGPWTHNLPYYCALYPNVCS